MITAARLMAHQMINGKYQTTMAMDQMPVLGHQVCFMICLTLIPDVLTCSDDTLPGLVHH